MHQHIQSFRSFLLPLACFLLTIYYGYHAYAGAHGLRVRANLSSEIARLTNQLSINRDARKHLEHKVSLMYSQNLDPDMLEEQARALLDYSRADELIIMR